MMKSKIFMIAGIAVALVACAGQATITPAQALAEFQTAKSDFCVYAQPSVAAMQEMTTNTPAQTDLLNKIADPLNKVCSATVPAAPATVQDFLTKAYPFVLQAIEASNWDTSKKQNVEFVLAGFKVALSVAAAKTSQ